MIYTESSEVRVSATESGVNLIIVTGDAYLQSYFSLEQARALISDLQGAVEGES